MLPPPRILDPMDAPPLRWGILAPGNIAADFAKALRHGTHQEVVAVGSRDPARARSFADRFGGAAYGSYEDLVADDRVDVVYVASPHSWHREQALLAISAGRHVLVEKAFTRNASEAREIFEAAERRGVFCMEAMWSRFLPHYDVIRRAVTEGALGRLQIVVADHGQQLYPNGPERLSSSELAGGALLDLGVYPVSFAAMLLPEVAAVAAVGPLTDEGVDAQESITLTGAEGELAVCTTTMTAQTANTAVVAGDRGRLEVDSWFYQPNAVRLVVDDAEIDRFEPPGREHGLGFEAAEVARCVAEGLTQSPLLPWAETVRVMELMDGVRRQLGVVFPGEANGLAR